jgi:hypothetical protein
MEVFIFVIVTITVVLTIRALTHRGGGLDSHPPITDDVIVLGDYIDPADKQWHQLTVKSSEIQKVHCALGGQTQQGKTYFGSAIFLQKIARGDQVIVLDPHSTIYNTVLSQMLAHGAFDDPTMRERVLFVDLPQATTRRKLYPALNILDRDLPLHTTAVGALEVVHRVWPELDASSALDNMVLYGCAVLLHHHLPLTLLPLVLTNETARSTLLETIADQEVVSYWNDEFNKLTKHHQEQEIGATMRRIRRLVFEPELRYSLSNTGAPNLLDFRTILKQGTSVFFDLHFESDLTTKLWGSLIMVALEQAVKSRLGVPERERRPCSIFVDEIGMFANVHKEHSEEGLNTFLQRTLGAGVSLWMCYQNLSTFPPSTRDGALDNCALQINFRTVRDAESASEQFFSVDPRRIKHMTYGQGMPRPTFSSVEEQKTMSAQRFKELQPQSALIKLPTGDTYHIMTPYVDKVDVDEQKLAEIEDYYLKTLFRSEVDITNDLDARMHALQIDKVSLERKKDAVPAPQARAEAPKPPRSGGPQRRGATIKGDASPPPPSATLPDEDDDDESRFVRRGPKRG